MIGHKSCEDCKEGSGRIHGEKALTPLMDIRHIPISKSIDGLKMDADWICLWILCTNNGRNKS